MERKHPDVNPKEYPLVYAIDKFTFAIVSKESPDVEGVVVQVLEAKPKSPRASDITPDTQDLMEAGPSNRQTPPPRANTPMGPPLTPSVSDEDFWSGLVISASSSVEETYVSDGSPVFSDVEEETMRIADIAEDDWLELDSWP
jgi:hypothetical protein